MISVYKVHVAVSLILQFNDVNYLLCRYGCYCCQPVWAQVANLPIREGNAGKGETFKADSHIACRSHAGPMPFPCHAVPLRV
jgi:hypothetical protein